MMATKENSDLKIMWIINSMAQFHICKSVEDILMQDNYVENENLEINGTINGSIKIYDNEQWINLKNVRIIPGNKHNVLSMCKLMEDGFSVSFSADKCVLSSSTNEIIEFELIDQEYTLVSDNLNNVTYSSKKEDVSSINEPQDNKIKLDQYNNVNLQEPEDWKDLISNFTAEEIMLWSDSMKEEISIIEENKVWTPTVPPKDVKPINCRWTYSIKRDHSGQIVKLRSRLVAKGCNQKFGQDYDQTYAPVVRPETIRSILILAGNHNLKTRHCDISSAFLYGQLEEVIYMRGPKGPWSDLQEKIFLLHKAMYGLKQAARAWNARIHNSLLSCAYNRSNADQCLYIKDQSYVLIHVEDLLLIGPDLSVIEQTIEQLRNEYKIKDLGPVKRYLGINIERNDSREYFYINQNDKILKLLKTHRMEESYPKDIPIVMSCGI